MRIWDYRNTHHLSQSGSIVLCVHYHAYLFEGETTPPIAILHKYFDLTIKKRIFFGNTKKYYKDCTQK